MAKYNLNWQDTDAQLVEALLLATGGEGAAPLLDLLLMIDATDGTVPELQELQHSLERLVAVNYVSTRKNKLALTAHFLETYEAPAEPEHEQQAILNLLQTNQLTPESVEEARTQLKTYKLRNYYQAYLEQFGG